MTLLQHIQPAKTSEDARNRFVRAVHQGRNVLDARQRMGMIRVGDFGSKVPKAVQQEVLARQKEIASGRLVAVPVQGISRKRQLTLVCRSAHRSHAANAFLEVAREVAARYPDIQNEEMIVDAACMNLVMYPERFDVMVTTNLFGDILSDLCAGLVGGLGMAPGANIGEGAAIFEAVHGSAPDIAGKGIANPIAAILSLEMVMRWSLGRADVADRIFAAVDKALQGGARTADLGGSMSTRQMADAILKHL